MHAAIKAINQPIWSERESAYGSHYMNVKESKIMKIVTKANRPESRMMGLPVTLEISNAIDR
jgi:hypothetical protein